jgi:Rrf2 family transcriptional regulator, cysteine metabolism repressor
MLKLSSRTNYGVRALVDLAQQSAPTGPPPDIRAKSGRSKPVPLSAISTRQSIPLPFLEQIFALLRRAGLVEAVRGAHGGYRLLREPEDLSLADIVAALEGPLGPALCVAPENFGPDCHVVEGCFARLFCQKLDGEISNALRSTHIADFCRELERLAPGGTEPASGRKIKIRSTAKA